MAQRVRSRLDEAGSKSHGSRLILPPASLPKTEYVRIASIMATFRRMGAAMTNRDLYIAAYDIASPKRLRTVPMALLQRVVIRGEVMLNSSVLGALAESGCAVIVLSGRHGRRLAIVQGRAHNDALLRVAQYSRLQDPLWRLDWAKRFVAA